MKLFRELIGPKSKYDRSIPYTYEARVPVIEGRPEYNSYLADTICGLVEHLDQQAIAPSEVEIFEIYRNEERLIDKTLCTSEDGSWLRKPDMCSSFHDHYEGHIHPGGCSFEDRDFKCNGP